MPSTGGTWTPYDKSRPFPAREDAWGGLMVRTGGGAEKRPSGADRKRILLTRVTQQARTALLPRAVVVPPPLFFA